MHTTHSNVTVCCIGDNIVRRPACVPWQHEGTVGVVTLSYWLLWESHSSHVTCHQCSSWQTTLYTWHRLSAQQVRQLSSSFAAFFVALSLFQSVNQSVNQSILRHSTEARATVRLCRIKEKCLKTDLKCVNGWSSSTVQWLASFFISFVLYTCLSETEQKYLLTVCNCACLMEDIVSVNFVVP